jgi:serine/threonine protein phosphatase PrpC
LDFTKENPALQELLVGRVFHALNERQSRAVEIDAPYAVGSSKGWVRSANEDAALVARLRFVGTPGRNCDVAIVCDGMGGMQHGRLSAQLALGVFVSRLLAQANVEPLRRRVERAILSAQQAVFDRVQGDGGTTLTAVCVEGTRTCVAHVGDSRAYEVDERGRLTQITRDDTLGAALKRAESDQGDFNRLIQYVGMPGGSEEGAFEPQILELTASLTRAGFILASDGVYGVGKDAVDRVASHSPSGFETIRRLINVADGFGGLDNASAIFIPDHPFAPESEGSGISLSLHTASGISQIWFGPASGSSSQPRDIQQPLPAGSVTPAHQPPPSPPAPSPSPGKPSRSPRPSTRGKKTAKGKDKVGPAKDMQALPEGQPRLEVFFPEDDGDQG